MDCKLPIAVHIILIVNNKVLLIKRKGTNFFDGFWSLPGGRLEDGETMIHGAIREAKEEIGIDIKPTNIKDHLIMHHNDQRGQRIYYFGLVNKYQGTPQNMEPDKCEEIDFFEIDNLPSNIIPHIKIAIKSILSQKNYLEYGFK